MNVFKKYKGRMIVTVVAIILIVLIAITASGRGKITQVERILGNIVTPLQSGLSKASNGVSNGVHSVKNVFLYKSENEKLTKEIKKLKQQVEKQERVISRSDFLRKEYELINNTKYDLIDAKIVGKDPGNWFEKFQINRGTKDGIKKGDIVVQGAEIEKDIIVEGLIGRVIDVGDNSAKVISIIDGTSSASLVIARTQDGGIGRGNLKGKITGQLFDDKSSVVKGDKVFTSGLGGVFPEDLYIGEVSKVTKKTANLLLDVEVTPAVEFNKLRNVFIIKKD